MAKIVVKKEESNDKPVLTIKMSRIIDSKNYLKFAEPKRPGVPNMTFDFYLLKGSVPDDLKEIEVSIKRG